MRIELTDTFAGELNYSWVKRTNADELIELGLLESPFTDRQLLKAIRKHFDLGSVKLIKKIDCGDFKVYKLNKCCIALTITWEY